jgi:hypothetical protein
VAAAAAIVFAAASALGLAAQAGAGAVGGGAPVHVASTGNKSELVKTLPIGKKPSSNRRVLMSMGPGGVGDLQPGDLIQAAADFQVTTCLKPEPDHPGARPRSCIGRVYGYDPHVQAQLVLAADDGDKTGTQLSKPRKLTCNQSQPNRNHHCVLFVPPSDFTVPNNLPCAADDCYINLIASAYHPGSRGNDFLIVGEDTGDGNRITQGKGRISLARYRPGDMDLDKPDVTTKPKRRALPLERSSGNERVVFELPLPNLREGEKLVFEGLSQFGIANSRINPLTRSRLRLSADPGTGNWPQAATDLSGQIGDPNGFNCTQGPSAHPEPCSSRKFAVLDVTRSVNQTITVQLVAGTSVVGDELDELGRGDKAKVRGGFIRVYRYRP